LRQVFKGLAQDLVWVLPGFPGLVLEVFQHPPHELFVYFEVNYPVGILPGPERLDGRRRRGSQENGPLGQLHSGFSVHIP